MRHTVTRIGSGWILLAAAVVTTGCFTHAHTLEPTRYAVEKQLPGARFEPEIKLTFGRVSLALARKIVRWADVEEPEVQMLRDVHRVELAIYRTHSLPEIGQAGFAIPRAARMADRGWQTIIHASNEGGATWVLMRPRPNGKAEEILVGALDDDELVLVKVRGDIDGMLERLRDESVLDIPGVIHADLEPEPGEPIAVVEMADESG